MTVTITFAQAEKIAANPGVHQPKDKRNTWDEIHQAARMLGQTLKFDLERSGSHVEIRLSQFQYDRTAVADAIIGGSTHDVAVLLADCATYYDYTVDTWLNSRHLIIRPRSFFFDVLKVLFEQPERKEPYIIEPRQTAGPATIQPRERAISLDQL